MAVTFYEKWEGELSGEQLSQLGLDPEIDSAEAEDLSEDMEAAMAMLG